MSAIFHWIEQRIPDSVRWILFVSLLVKLVLSAVIPLTADEAYYWVWSHHMQLSFFDHPPAVAWLFWLTHPLENLGSAVRWAGVVIGQFTLCVWVMILKPHFTDEQLRLWLWLGLLSPLFGIGSMILTPDIPLLFFWALTLLLFVEWLDKPSLAKSMLLGLSCGLGLASKYIMVLEPFFLLGGCLTIPAWRTAARRGWFWILIGVAAGSSPVWIWNLMNHFVSFRFQVHHGLGQDVWKPSWTIEYPLLQILIIFPTVFYWAVKGSFRAPYWLRILAWGPLGFFFLTSFRGYVEANWPIVAYPAVLALAVWVLPKSVPSYRATIGIWSAALVIACTLIVTRWSPTGEPIKTREFFQFEPLRAKAASLSPVFARSYQMAAQLSFDLKKPVPKLRHMNRRDFYDFLPESEPAGPIFYVLAEREDTLPDPLTLEGYKIAKREAVADAPQFEIWEVRR